jgi:ketosteroid isomerase-like protein
MKERDLPVRRDLRHSFSSESWANDGMNEGDGEIGAMDEDIRSAVNQHPLLSSVTDLLISWLPEAEEIDGVAGSNGLWDRYFGTAGGAQFPAGDTPRAPLSAGDAEIIRPLVASFEPWDIEAAESAVDCLFRFLRALQSCDVPAAMACISEDYHLVENGGEVDRGRLQLGLERLVDNWRGADVQISTTEVPDPVFHPAGVLIPATIQVDFGGHAQRSSQLISRLFVFRKTSRGEWRISSIAKIPRVTK